MLFFYAGDCGHDEEKWKLYFTRCTFQNMLNLTGLNQNA